MNQPSFMLLSTILLAGLAPFSQAGDDYAGTKKKAYAKEKAWTVTAEEAAAMLDQALDSCCATGACAESGECAPVQCEACDAGECSAKKHPSPMKQLVKLVSYQPDVLADLMPLVAQRFLAEDTGEAQRQFLLEVLTSSEGEGTVACGEKLYAARPAAFSGEHALAFTSKGSDVFAKDLRKRAKAGQVLPCAYFVLKGKKAGASDKLAKASLKHLVRSAKADSVNADSARDQLIAARVLAELGKAELLPTVQRRVYQAVLAALDQGELDAARSMALQAEFFAKGGKYGNPLGLGSMGSQIRWHVVGRSKEVATADDVFEVIEAITPL